MAQTLAPITTVPAQRTAIRPTVRHATTYRFTLATRLGLGVAGLTAEHHQALDGLTVTLDDSLVATPKRRAAALLDALREVHTPNGGWGIDASGYVTGNRRIIGQWVRVQA